MNEGVDTSRYPSAAEVRAWGLKVNPRAMSRTGRLPFPLIKAWNKAHPDRPYVESQSHHGTPAGYRTHDCRCDRCLEAGRHDARTRHRNAADERWDEASA